MSQVLEKMHTPLERASKCRSMLCEWRAGEEYLRKDGEAAAGAQSHNSPQEGSPPTRTRDHGGMKQSRWIPADPTIKHVAYERGSAVGQRWGNDHEREFTEHCFCVNGCRRRRLTGRDWVMNDGERQARSGMWDAGHHAMHFSGDRPAQSMIFLALEPKWLIRDG